MGGIANLPEEAEVILVHPLREGEGDGSLLRLGLPTGGGASGDNERLQVILIELESRQLAKQLKIFRSAELQQSHINADARSKVANPSTHPVLKGSNA